MSFLVLGQASPESFLVVINDINLEATVTNRSDVAAAWINGTNPIDDRHLIVGISTIHKYGTIPPPISKSPQTPSESMASVDPSASAPDSSNFLAPEIDDINNPSSIPIDPSLSHRSLGESSSGTIATLQLCCGNRCLVFSLLHNDGGIPDDLVDFLFDRDQVTLVGTGIRRAGDWLGRSDPDPMLVCRDPWELGEARAWRGLRRLTTLDQLAGKLLGREKAIRVQQVRCWDRWPLSENQMAVACLDVYLLSQIGEKLVEMNREAFRCCFMSSI